MKQLRVVVFSLRSYDFDRRLRPERKATLFRNLHFDDLLSYGVADEIGQARQFELQHDARPVPFHSADTYAQLVGNLSIHFSLS